MSYILHYWVSHSFFPVHVLISYVYANCTIPMREDLWDALVAFADRHDSSWIMRGDFNII